jgi:hypothetical protein
MKIIITETQLKGLIPEGINVWHGSDRKFDTFDMSKVGSGDGKSLGGWGIYFSDSREVSERYFTSNGFVNEYELRYGNYFDLDSPASEDGDKIINGLQHLDVDEDNIDELRTDYIEQSENYGDVTNKQVYDWLSFILNGEKEASLFLKSLGYVGNTFIDKWDANARNYVVFDADTIIQ